MLRKLESTHFYDTKVKRDNEVDACIRSAENVDVYTKKKAILEFFNKPDHKLSESSMISLRQIINDSLFHHTKFKNYNKSMKINTNDLLYVFCTSSPRRRYISTLDIYLEDMHKQKLAQHNVKALYALLLENKSSLQQDESSDDNLIFIDDEEEIIEIDF
jgi:hypothetical protein